jgi:hypothetical protein
MSTTDVKEQDTMIDMNMEGRTASIPAKAVMKTILYGHRLVEMTHITVSQATVPAVTPSSMQKGVTQKVRGRHLLISNIETQTACPGTTEFPHHTSSPNLERDTLMINAADLHLLLLFLWMDLTQRYIRHGTLRTVAPEVRPAIS